MIRGQSLWRTNRPTTVLTIAAILGLYGPAHAQVVRVDEAERGKITCKAKELGQSIWASGGALTPPFWGFVPGESVEWTIRIPALAKDLKLGVRYSYAAVAYRNFHHTENPKRTLHLIVDGRDSRPIAVRVPDTGDWDIFDTTTVDLPELAAGEHVLKLVSPEPHMTTNVDCFILYRGGLDNIPPALRSTTISTCSPTTAPATSASAVRFVIRVTPKALLRLKTKPEMVCKQFNRIYDYYEDFMGWTPPPFGIHIIEDDKWPNPGATAFQNGAGVFFRAGVMHTEQGNWCHEMTHMFYVAHFPPWFDESSVQMLTTFNWIPALFARGRRPQADPTYRAWEADARRFLNTPGETTGNMVLIQDAVRVKYGPDVFKKFFHACVEAGRKKELDFTPGRHLTKAEIVKYMSLAAGEDVLPIYQRWTGFRDAP